LLPAVEVLLLLLLAVRQRHSVAGLLLHMPLLLLLLLLLLLGESCLIHGRSRLLLFLCGMQIVLQVLLQHFHHASTLQVVGEGRLMLLLLLLLRASAFLLHLLLLDDQQLLKSNGILSRVQDCCASWPAGSRQIPWWAVRGRCCC
jgi:hypothetical protein